MSTTPDDRVDEDAGAAGDTDAITDAAGITIADHDKGTVAAGTTTVVAGTTTVAAGTTTVAAGTTTVAAGTTVLACNPDAGRDDDFAAAVEAVVAGDLATLRAMLAADPRLIHARSSRDHHATLLHYVGANGVEAPHQRTPPNAVDVATLLLDAGAAIDAPAAFYGGDARTLGLIATSIHPHRAGLQLALIDLFLARGARLDDRIVNDCLVNGRGAAAVHLATRGAPLDLEGAAGVGRLDLVEHLHDTAGSADRHRPFAWACEYGRTAVVASFLDRGFPVAASLPNHGQTGLHWAAAGAHLDTVRLLLARGATADARDPSFDGTPADWARHGARDASPGERERHRVVLELLDGVDPESHG